MLLEEARFKKAANQESFRSNQRLWKEVRRGLEQASLFGVPDHMPEGETSSLTNEVEGTRIEHPRLRRLPNDSRCIIMWGMPDSVNPRTLGAELTEAGIPSIVDC